MGTIKSFPLLWRLPLAEPIQEPNQKPVGKGTPYQALPRPPSRGKGREIPSGRRHGRRPAEAARRRLGGQDHSPSPVTQ